MDAVTRRAISKAGTPESVWLPWLAGQAIPSASIDELCPGLARLVVLAPHPDDEILACGGLLAMRAARGLPSLVVAMTDGEASHGSGDALACARLATQRVAERYAGLGALGLAPASVVRLGIADGCAAQAIPVIAGRLRALLRPADVIVTTWQLDGHPDHEAASAAAQLAADIGCRLLQAPVWMWHWTSPGDDCMPWRRLVACDLPVWARRAKREALSCHQSQLQERGHGLGPVLVPSIVQRSLRAREYFFH